MLSLHVLRLWNTMDTTCTPHRILTTYTITARMESFSALDENIALVSPSICLKRKRDKLWVMKCVKVADRVVESDRAR